MPHLTIEYSANLAGFPEAEVLRALNQTVTASAEVADEADLKSRCVVHDCYAIGTAPEGRAFVHAQLRLLSGRTPEAKKDFAELVGRRFDVRSVHSPFPWTMVAAAVRTA